MKLQKFNDVDYVSEKIDAGRINGKIHLFVLLFISLILLKFLQVGVVIFGFRVDNCCLMFGFLLGSQGLAWHREMLN